MDESTSLLKILVLIADDDSDTRDILRILLQLGHYRVVEVADGYEMLEKSNLEKPDLIIADIMMPKIDGFEAVKQLRQDSYFQHTPVLFISCIVTGEAIVSQMKHMPRCAFLEKPFDHKTLLNTIQNLLNQKS